MKSENVIWQPLGISMNKWYNYIIPHRTSLFDRSFVRWFNFIIGVYPVQLKWELEAGFGDKSGRQLAFVAGEDMPYVIALKEDNSSYVCTGPGMDLTYRPSSSAVYKACEHHYRRHHLKMCGILTS